MRGYGRLGGTGGTQTRRSRRRSLHPKGKEALHLAGPVCLASAEKLHDETGKNLSGCMFRLEIEENLHVKQALPDLAIDGTEKVERHGQLEHELVDHDQVANGHRPCPGS
jgi:hypothetical protein